MPSARCTGSVPAPRTFDLLHTGTNASGASAIAAVTNGPTGTSGPVLPRDSANRLVPAVSPLWHRDTGVPGGAACRTGLLGRTREVTSPRGRPPRAPVATQEARTRDSATRPAVEGIQSVGHPNRCRSQCGDRLCVRELTNRGPVNGHAAGTTAL